MKKHLTLFLLLSSLNNFQAQVASSCIAPQQFTEKYSRDIAQLAVKRLYDHKSPDTVFVRIPQKHIDSISQGMAAIFNATSIPQRDSVFNLYCVHNMRGFPGSYNGYYVEVDTTNNSWTRAWQNKQTITGNSKLDQFTTKYDLDVAEFYNGLTGNSATLSTASSWNPLALSDSLEKIAIPGIIAVSKNGTINGSGIITYKVVGNTKYYDFYFEYGDLGTGNYRMWKFKVNPDCSVNYLGFEDDASEPFAAETPQNCNAFASVAEKNRAINYILFPNPVTDVITIKSAGTFGTSNYLLTDQLGRSVLTGTLTQETTKVDIRQLANGIYFLQLDNEKKQVFKVIKQ